VSGVGCRWRPATLIIDYLNNPNPNPNPNLKEIIDHRTHESAVKMDDTYIVHHKTGRKRLKRTTQGWQLCMKWNDESTTCWVPLKDLKESNPVEVAEYAVNMKLVVGTLYHQEKRPNHQGCQEALLQSVPEVWH
jgi:hypothetical protein